MSFYNKPITYNAPFFYNGQVSVVEPPCPYRPETSDQADVLPLNQDSPFAYLESVCNDFVVAARYDDSQQTTGSVDDGDWPSYRSEENVETIGRADESDLLCESSQESDALSGTVDAADTESQRSDASDETDEKTDEEDTQNRRRDECS